MPSLQKAVGDGKPVIVRNGLYQRQSQSVRTFFLGALVETLEDLLLVQGGGTRVGYGQGAVFEAHLHLGTGFAVQAGVLHQVGYQHRGQRLVHLYREGLRQGKAPVNVSRGENLAVEFLLFPHQGGDVHRGAFGELVVVDLGEQQQGFVQAGEALERALHLQHFAHLFFGEFRVV